MFKYAWKSMTVAGFVAMTWSPASAQLPPLPPLPRLEIHIGTTAPPHMRQEQRPRSPGPDYIWVGGSWDWQGGQWAWIDGRWERPERPQVRWVEPRYARDGGGWRYEPGHWSHVKLVEGADYMRWKKERHTGKGHKVHHHHDRDRDADQDRGHDHRPD